MEDERCTLTKSELRIIFEKIKERDRKQKEVMDECKKRMKLLQEKVNELVLNFTLNGIVELRNLIENTLASWPPMAKYDPEDLLDFVLNTYGDHGTGIVEGQNLFEQKMKKTVVPKQTHNESLKKREIELKEYEADLQRKYDRMKKEMEVLEVEMMALKEKRRQLEAEKIQYQKELES